MSLSNFNGGFDCEKWKTMLKTKTGKKPMDRIIRAWYSLLVHETGQTQMLLIKPSNKTRNFTVSFLFFRWVFSLRQKELFLSFQMILYITHLSLPENYFNQLRRHLHECDWVLQFWFSQSCFPRLGFQLQILKIKPLSHP